MAYNTPAMEPRIQYAQTKDGVRIAYATAGEGPPVVRVIGWFTHLDVHAAGWIITN